jgi:hypothetical protein
MPVAAQASTTLPKPSKAPVTAVPAIGHPFDSTLVLMKGVTGQRLGAEDYQRLPSLSHRAIRSGALTSHQGV